MESKNIFESLYCGDETSFCSWSRGRGNGNQTQEVQVSAAILVVALSRRRQPRGIYLSMSRLVLDADVEGSVPERGVVERKQCSAWKSTSGRKKVCMPI